MTDLNITAHAFHDYNLAIISFFARLTATTLEPLLQLGCELASFYY